MEQSATTRRRAPINCGRTQEKSQVQAGVAVYQYPEMSCHIRIEEIVSSIKTSQQPQTPQETANYFRRMVIYNSARVGWVSRCSIPTAYGPEMPAGKGWYARFIHAARRQPRNWRPLVLI